MKLNVITTFSGYDSQCLALDAIKAAHPDFDYNLVAWCEIDEHAIKGHNQLFPQYAARNVGDITKVDWHKFADQQIDLLTYSSPCQDISQAGKQLGLQEGSETRSSLLWNVIDAIKVLKPRFLMQENVRALVSSKFMPDFMKWCQRLEQYGYRNYWAVMNAKDYGVPQNRERVFMISVRNDQPERFSWPRPFPLQKKLADLLEDGVAENYYLTDASVDKFLYTSADFQTKPDFSDSAVKQSSEVDDLGLPLHVTAPSGKVYNLEYTTDDAGQKHPHWYRYETDVQGKEHRYTVRFRIRKLTPRECFRLMGVPDPRIDQLLETELVPEKKGSTAMVERYKISRSQLYKMAGNSIVVDCMKYIFENLFYPTEAMREGMRTDINGHGVIDFEF